MCEFCNNVNAFDKPVLDEELDLGLFGKMGVGAAIDKNGDLLIGVTHPSWQNNRNADWSLRIKYCPFCGREF